MELDKQPSQVYEAGHYAAEHLGKDSTKKSYSNGVQDHLSIENSENSFVPTVGRWGSEWPS